MNLLVTGALGFIGSSFVRQAHALGHVCLGFDAGIEGSHPDNLIGEEVELFIADLRDPDALKRAFAHFDPDAVIHFAAQSHVDRSISGPIPFVASNVVGTANLLEASRAHFQALPWGRKEKFRYIQVSTDEVFGALELNDEPFNEVSPIDPRSPYSASKACGDLLAMAWWQTYGLPVVVTRCSNNFGARQFPEKLIPKTILAAASLDRIPVYGKGQQIRDWLHVEDHCRALLAVLDGAKPGASYAIGGGTEMTNIALVGMICDVVDQEMGRQQGESRSQIAFVEERPGHDFRYAIDSSKISNELGWSPTEDFTIALRATVRWYLSNSEWTKKAKDLLTVGARGAS